MPSQATVEGLSLLKRGYECIKFSQRGHPSLVLLKLSADEATISWQKLGLSKLKRKSDKRAIEVPGIARVDVGRDSAAFKNAAAKSSRGAPHLSLSIVMRPSHAIDGRETLDLCCADEESFGLLVAALRALVARRSEQAAQAAAKDRPWGAGLPIITAGVSSPARAPDAAPPQPVGRESSEASSATADDPAAHGDEAAAVDEDDGEGSPPDVAAATAASHRIAALERTLSEMQVAAALHEAAEAAAAGEPDDEEEEAEEVDAAEPHAEGGSSSGAAAERASSAAPLGAAEEPPPPSPKTPAAEFADQAAVGSPADASPRAAKEEEAEDDGENEVVEVSVALELEAADTPDAVKVASATSVAAAAASPKAAAASPKAAAASPKAAAANVPAAIFDPDADDTDEVGEAAEIANDLFRRASFEGRLFDDDDGEAEPSAAASAADALFGAVDDDDDDESNAALSDADGSTDAKLSDDSDGGASAPAGGASPAARGARARNPFDASDALASTSRAVDAAADLFSAAASMRKASVGAPMNPFDTVAPPAAHPAPARAAASSNPFDAGDPGRATVLSNPFGDGDDRRPVARANPFGDETPEQRAARLMSEIDDI